MTDPEAPRHPRRNLAWLPVAGATIGVALLALRLATLPFEEGGPFLIALIVAVVITLTIFVGLRVARTVRMRAAGAAFPDAVLMPIVVGTDTAAASRWIAEQLGDAGLVLRTERNAILAADAAGLHVLTGARPPFSVLPAATLSVRGVEQVRMGAGRAIALVVGVRVGDVVAPLPLVPARRRGLQLGSLDDSELLEVMSSLEDAFAGRPATPGWGY